MSKYPTFEHHWRRGHYVAEITGPDPRYRIHREFCEGTIVKSRRVVVHEFPNPCFIEVTGWAKDRGGKWREYYMVTRATVERIPDGVDIARITAGPRPGEPGAYGDGRCRCGADVATYDADGMPMCADHVPGADIDETLPVPA